MADDLERQPTNAAVRAGRAKMNAPTDTARQVLFEGLSRDFSPTELRNLASSLLRLADAVDQDWDGALLTPPPHLAKGALFRGRSDLSWGK